MKANHFILLGVLASACMFSCSTPSASEQIVGEWSVQWVTRPEDRMPLEKSMNYTMNGKINIGKDGAITIDAYGYKGCVFGSDTLSHQLNWKIEADTVLSLYNDGDAYGIPYHIVEISESQVKLQWLDDVYLFLSK